MKYKHKSVDSKEAMAARVLGHYGGEKGGPARAVKLPKFRRTAIAKKAADVRWHNKT